MSTMRLRAEYRVETRTIVKGQETGWYPEGGDRRVFRSREAAQAFLEECRDWLDNSARFEHRIVARAVSDWEPVVPTVQFPSDTAPLPTEVCDPIWHARGGGCFQCCDGCNYQTHRCHFCGDDLLHNGRLPDGSVNECYVKCERCGHIGHEHFADSCRGYDYELGGDTQCGCTRLVLS